MNIIHTTVPTIEEMVLFLKGTKTAEIKNDDTINNVYAWMTKVLTLRRYLLSSRQEKGIVRRYLIRCTGYSESHTDHCIRQYRDKGVIRRQERDCRTEFVTVYTKADIALLATYSEAMSHQNGKALQAGMKDMYHIYNDLRFERLAHLSCSHLYTLKQTVTYRNMVKEYTKTQSVVRPIGERKKPYPEGKPGFIRVDSVHQGDKDKIKGVYHVNLVDEVNQYEVVCTVEGIAESFMVPALANAITQFPFRVINFHSDNGSEYINQVVAKLLETLRIKQTKSRSRKTNDNALVEGKNAAVVRTHFGYHHIPKQYAGVMEQFNQSHLNPFLVDHRKCAFPTEYVDAKGKIRKVYEVYLTPVEKLLSLPNVETFLIPGMTIKLLTEKLKQTDHLTAAIELQKAKQKLFALMK